MRELAPHSAWLQIGIHSGNGSWWSRSGKCGVFVGVGRLRGCRRVGNGTTSSSSGGVSASSGNIRMLRLRSPIAADERRQGERQNVVGKARIDDIGRHASPILTRRGVRARSITRADHARHLGNRACWPSPISAGRRKRARASTPGLAGNDFARCDQVALVLREIAGRIRSRNLAFSKAS